MKPLKEVRNILSPFGELDLLYYYSLIAEYLQNFLKEKEIATKTYLSKEIPKILKRGSQLEPIFIRDLKEIDRDFLQLRVGHHLSDVKDRLNYKQILLWEYFFPRKMIDLFYACNKEHPGLPIERIFIDIDKGATIASEAAQQVTKSLLLAIQHDMAWNEFVNYKPVVMWTGNSFHIYLLLSKKVNHQFYEKYFSYSKEGSRHLKHKENTLIYRWADAVRKETGIKVEPGHKKTEDHLILDTSGTPSGKLARSPFSLHVSNLGEHDGIAVPLSEKQLGKRNLVKELRSLTPEKVVEDLERYARLL